MEWLKKHWEIIAAIAIGIPLLYWLYQTYQANQEQAAQAATDATANADAAASADQLQVAYGGYYSGSGGGSGSVNEIQNQPTTSPSITTQPVAQVQPSINYGTDLVAPPANQNPDYSYSQNPSVPNNPNPIYAPGSPQAIALGYSPAPATTPSSVMGTFFGTGGGNNDTAPVSVQPTVPDQSILTHVSSGVIPEHGTALPKTPSPVDLASLGGRI